MMGVKKYKLIPEKEYERWKAQSTTSNLESSTSNIFNSNMPDELKMKFAQDMVRVDQMENAKVKSISRTSSEKSKRPKYMHDASTQQTEETPKVMERGTSPPPPLSPPPQAEDSDAGTIPTPPPLPPLNKPASSLRKRKSASSSTDFDPKGSSLLIARYLATIGVTKGRQGQAMIGAKEIPGSSYAECIRQLNDGRCKRTDATMQIINVLRKNVLPDNVFSAGILAIIKGKSVKTSSTSTSTSTCTQWDEY